MIEEYYDSGITHQETSKEYASTQRAVSPPTIRGQPFLANLKMAISAFRSK